MKKLLPLLCATVLMSGVAQAADYQAVPEPTVGPTWTGFYGGLGGDWVINGDASYQIPSARELKPDNELGGAMLGGELGYNYQMGILLLGAEIQGLWSNVEGDKDYYDGMLRTHTSVDWLAMAKLRGGAAFDRFAVWGTGGYAGADVLPSAQFRYCAEAGNCATNWGDERWANGFMYGIGGAVMLTDNWWVGLEWNHVVLDNASFSGQTTHGRYAGMPIDVNGDFNLDLIMATVNYRF